MVRTIEWDLDPPNGPLVAAAGRTVMSETFSNPPITEALIDIRVQMPPTRVLADLDPLLERLHSDYPSRSERRSWAGTIALGAVEQPVVETTRAAPDGYILRSLDGVRVVQARLDGFTFSWLKPYESWAALREEARLRWGEFESVMKPERVTRIAVRFINNIQIPLGRDFSDFVRTGFELAPGLPRGVSNFFLRIDLPFDNPRVSATITQTLGPDRTDHIPYVFDIDVHRSLAEGGAYEPPWGQLDELREVKNRIFHDSLTDEARELFQ